MRFPEHVLEEIKARLPLSRIIGRKLAFDAKKSQARKGVHWACCPFHGEKTPSFRVDDGAGRYHCFGCKASGDHFQWLIEREGQNFAEAVSLAAKEAGVTLPSLSPEQERHELKRASAFDLNRLAQAFYHARLKAPEGEAARHYLEGRGVPQAQWEAMGLGFAPGGRGLLARHLMDQGHTEEALVEAGLAREGVGSNPPSDYFFNRLMFPIRDRLGRVAGFGGRALAEDQKPKYLNTPESPAYSKKRTLWNLDRAQDAAREANGLVIVEGYLDVAAVERAGIAHVAAPCGTALGPEQLALAWRVADEPVICLDGDAAGQMAAVEAMKAALPLLQPGRSLGFVTLPDGLDPDEFLKAHGEDALKAALGRPMSLADMLWRALVAPLRKAKDGTVAAEPADVSTPERVAKFQALVAEAAAAIADEDVRKAYENDLAHRLKAFWKDKGIRAGAQRFGKKREDGGGPSAGGASGGGGVPAWGPEECERMNQHFAMVIAGQGTRILCDHPDELGKEIGRFKLMEVPAFRQFWSNRRARIGGRLDTVANLWIDDFHRRTYKGLLFWPQRPGETEAPGDFFNLFRGWPHPPVANPALAQPWLDHVFENLAGSDPALYDWIVSWFAWMVQFPRERSGVSLVLRGGQGAGKTITGAIVGSLFPANYFLIDNPRFLTGQFNAHLAACLFLQADEGFWAGDKQAEGQLKGLVTSKFQMIEYKGIDPVRVMNYINLMISSNEDWVVPANLRERRFAVIDVQPHRMQDLEYFGRMAEIYHKPEARAALLHALLTWKIDVHALKKVPATEALFAQKVRSFDPFMGWLHELLLEGRVGGDGGSWPLYVETRDLHANFLKRAERLNLRHPLSADSFGRRLRAIVPGIERRQNKERRWCYILPGLEVCRDDFVKAVDYQIDWEQGGAGGLEKRLDELGYPNEAPRRRRSGESGDEVVQDF